MTKNILKIHKKSLTITKTILISTHILQEVKAVADQVILINEGHVVFDGTPNEMSSDGTLEEAFHRLTKHGTENEFDKSTLTASTNGVSQAGGPQ